MSKLKKLALGAGGLFAGLCLLGSVAGHSAAPVTGTDQCAGYSHYIGAYEAAMYPFQQSLKDAGYHPEYVVRGAQRSQSLLADAAPVPPAFATLDRQAKLTLTVAASGMASDNALDLNLRTLNDDYSAALAACPIS